MSYSKNETRKRNRRQFIVKCILFLIGIAIGNIMISGIVHIICCRCVETKPIEETAVVETIEIPEPDFEITNLGEYELTAYCACEKCCGKTDGITASGVKAVQGVTVAADTKIHPFGTKLFINGHKYIVQDRGGAIKGNKIDIYFDNHQEALEFGVQHKEIFLIEEGEPNA